MKKIFDAPKMTVSRFDVEDIIKTSGVTAEANVETQMKQQLSSQKITLRTDVIKLTF